MRYARIWPLVVAAVPMAYRTVFWDNSTADGPIRIATFRQGLADAPPAWPAWCPPEIAALGTP